MKHVTAAILPLLVSTSLMAQDKAMREADDYYRKSLDQLLRIETPLKAEVGSRSGERDALEAEVPIDVITAAQLETSGYTELGKALSKFIPGFNFPRPTVTDGTDHALPFTLRGMNPDQVLVLINGKRLHQGSLLHVNGTIGRGTSGVDINTIPLRSIDRIEVLRDGAAAQYGSDAIAGIINIILKGYGHDNQATVSYGLTTKGDGVVKQTDIFYSHALRNDGFLNISAEGRDRGRTNRAGPDSRDSYRINHILGDTDAQDVLISFNTEIPGDYFTIYGHGLLDRRNSSGGALKRLKGDPRNNPAIYPDGFLPMIEPRINDYSVSAGVKGVSSDKLHWDLSLTHGYNDFHFYVANSQNDSLGRATPTAFDSGGTAYTQDILNLDLSKKVDKLSLAGGMEYRRENYRIYRGDEASYVLGSASSYAGAQGFPGFRPENEVNADRNNHALYLDAKYAFSPALTLEGAARQEHYSDFGGNLDMKAAAAYRPHQDILLRASSSTGFRAPSLSQAYYTATVSAQYLQDRIIQAGTFGVYHPVSVALGATPLKPEKSLHHTFGIVYQPSRDFSVSADYFNTDIDDRIMLTGNITNAISPAVGAILQQYGVQSARYFTNAIATRTQGIDLRLDYKRDFEGARKLKVAASYHYDRTKIANIYPLASILGAQTQAAVIDPVTQAMIEDLQPHHGVKVLTQYDVGRYRGALNLNYYGSQSYAGKVSGGKWTVDIDLAYQPMKNVAISVGGENIFDVMPDKREITSQAYSSGNGVLQYLLTNPFGLNGAFYYARVNIKF